MSNKSTRCGYRRTDNSATPVALNKANKPESFV